MIRISLVRPGLTFLLKKLRELHDTSRCDCSKSIGRIEPILESSDDVYFPEGLIAQAFAHATHTLVSFGMLK